MCFVSSVINDSYTEDKTTECTEHREKIMKLFSNIKIINSMCFESSVVNYSYA